MVSIKTECCTLIDHLRYMRVCHDVRRGSVQIKICLYLVACPQKAPLKLFVVHSASVPNFRTHYQSGGELYLFVSALIYTLKCNAYVMSIRFIIYFLFVMSHFHHDERERYVDISISCVETESDEKGH